MSEGSWGGEERDQPCFPFEEKDTVEVAINVKSDRFVVSAFCLFTIADFTLFFINFVMPTGDAFSSGHLVLSHFGTCMCSNVESNLSWTNLVSELLTSNIPRYFYFTLCLTFSTPCFSYLSLYIINFRFSFIPLYIPSHILIQVSVHASKTNEETNKQIYINMYQFLCWNFNPHLEPGQFWYKVQ